MTWSRAEWRLLWVSLIVIVVEYIYARAVRRPSSIALGVHTWSEDSLTSWIEEELE